MTNRNYATGKTGYPRTNRFHRTYKEAQARIARALVKDPENVKQGLYYIDPMNMAKWEKMKRT